MKSDKELRKSNPELYNVARNRGTESTFSSDYLHTDSAGTFHCAVCNAPIFSTEAKFDSGSGWPSFTDPINTGAVELRPDDSHGMNRTEVVCKNCDAHLGHVFPDGPKKESGACDRYCINGVSLELK